MIPLALAVGSNLVGGAQVPLFAVFGAFALLVFADFPGNRAARATAYAGLAVVGCVLITLGTLVSRIAWLAVAAMFAVGVLVLFAGVFSAALAAGSRAALLTFVLPVATPAPTDVIPSDCWAGRSPWWSACRRRCICSRPASTTDCATAPPRHAPRSRICSRVAAIRPPPAPRWTRCSSSFLAATTRPVGLSAGSRALIRVVDDLQWLTDRLAGADPARSSAPDSAARMMRAAAAVLPRPRPNGLRDDLTAAVGTLDAERDREFALSAALTAHAVDSTVAITGRVVWWSARAEARPPIDRVLGRGLDVDDLHGPIPVVLTHPRYAAGYLRAESVSLQNSLRGGFGLAIAVAITQFFPVHHGFWIVLGTLSVLRSSALSTGSTLLRAIVGTTLGFVAGALLIVLVGTGPVVLWLLLPAAVFLSAFVPEVVSFAAGQAAFTVTVLILFNLLQPTGWRVGLVRVEDVAVGCLAAGIVALLLWPRGVAAGVDAAIAAANRAGAAYLLRRGASGHPTRRRCHAIGDGRARRVADTRRRHPPVPVRTW